MTSRLKRENVFAPTINLEEEFFTPNYPKSDASIRLIDASLSDNFIFATLTSDERMLLIDSMIMDTVEEDTVIIKQGTVGDFFYVLEEGQVSYTVDGNLVGSSKTGASFGELALLYNCPRSCSCIADTDCIMWKVDQKTFRFMLANNNSNQMKDIHAVLKKVPFLSELGDRTLSRLVDAMTTVTFPDEERIISKGDTGEVFYILRQGTVRVHEIGDNNTIADQVIGPGDWFGERALVTGEPRTASVTSTSFCQTLCLSREIFEKVLGPLKDLMEVAQRKRLLAGVPLFATSNLQPFEMARLTELVTEFSYPKGKVLCESGMCSNHVLYIIRSGRLKVESGGKVTVLNERDFTGEQSLLAKEGTISETTITVEETAICEVLTKAAVERVIGETSRLLQKGSGFIKRQDPTVRLKDLIKFHILGVGTFGKVWLVSHKRTGKAFALKVLAKKEVIKHHQAEGVVREKNIMATCNHPFVVNLICTFQDDHSLYMVIELVQGGELFSVIHTETRDGIPNANSRFYAACILESLSHLHQRQICYRDLKPENILIDRQGYCILVDLGFAKVLKDNKKTYTLCGTPEYLSPEIILSKGHDTGVDFWAFGVLIYEMVVGRSPFYSYGTDQVTLFKRIVQARYFFPPGLVHDLAKNLIERLIVRRQAYRLGCLAGGDIDIRDHAWFASIDVDKLLKKKIRAPWIPRIRDPLDTSNFDSYLHIEQDESKRTYKAQLSAHDQILFLDF